MINEMNTRPHPGPLPQEREKQSPPSAKMNTLSVFRPVCAKIKKTAAATIGFQLSTADDSLPPLPGGEGFRPR